jgi:hypothetical protein
MIADTRAGGGSRVLDQDQMAIEIGTSSPTTGARELWMG